MVKFAKCCNPLPGDELIGFITKGYGVSVHKRDCPNVTVNMKKPEYEGRWVSAYWEQGASLMGTSSQYFEAMLRIYAKDNIGLLAQITVALADMRVNLVSVSTQKSSGNDIIINLTVNAKNLEHVKSIVSRLRTIDNIDDVTRGFGS